MRELRDFLSEVFSGDTLKIREGHPMQGRIISGLLEHPLFKTPM